MPKLGKGPESNEQKNSSNTFPLFLGIQLCQTSHIDCSETCGLDDTDGVSKEDFMQ